MDGREESDLHLLLCKSADKFFIKILIIYDAVFEPKQQRQQLKATKTVWRKQNIKESKKFKWERMKWKIKDKKKRNKNRRKTENYQSIVSAKD